MQCPIGEVPGTLVAASYASRTIWPRNAIHLPLFAPRRPHLRNTIRQEHFAGETQCPRNTVPLQPYAQGCSKGVLAHAGGGGGGGGRVQTWAPLTV